MSIEELIIQINKLHNMRPLTLERKVQLGRLLHEVQTSIKTGWYEWVEANCDFSPQTAGNYMRMFKRAGRPSETRPPFTSEESIELLEYMNDELEATLIETTYERDRLKFDKSEVAHIVSALAHDKHALQIFLRRTT